MGHAEFILLVFDRLSIDLQIIIQTEILVLAKQTNKKTSSVDVTRKLSMRI